MVAAIDRWVLWFESASAASVTTGVRAAGYLAWTVTNNNDTRADHRSGGGGRR